MKLMNLIKLGFLTAAIATLSACGTMKAASNLEDGAGETAMQLWDKWVKCGGEIACATTWERKVNDDVTPEDIDDALMSVATEMGIKPVGTLPLSDELKARGIKTGYLKVYSFCNPVTARHMVSFSPNMAAYLPCRIVVVERKNPKTGKSELWLYTLNMDMMVKMGKKLPPQLKKEAMKVRNTIAKMLDAAATGDF